MVLSFFKTSAALVLGTVVALVWQTRQLEAELGYVRWDGASQRQQAQAMREQVRDDLARKIAVLDRDNTPAIFPTVSLVVLEHLWQADANSDLALSRSELLEFVGGVFEESSAKTTERLLGAMAPLMQPLAGNQYSLPTAAYRQAVTALVALADGDCNNDGIVAKTIGAVCNGLYQGAKAVAKEGELGIPLAQSKWSPQQPRHERTAGAL